MPPELWCRGAKAIATNPATNLIRESTSGHRREYRFSLLPAGASEIRIEKSGFAVPTNRIAVTVGQEAVLNFRLDRGGATQLVKVNSEMPAIEVERTQQSNTINQHDVRNLPIDRRGYLSFAMLATGGSDSSFRVTQTPDSGLVVYPGSASCATLKRRGLCIRKQWVQRQLPPER